MLGSAALGVVALSTGIVLGQFSVARQEDAKAAADQLQAYDLLEEAKDLSTGANLAYIVGGLSLGAAVFFLTMDLLSDPPSGVSPKIACGKSGCLGEVLIRF